MCCILLPLVILQNSERDPEHPPTTLVDLFFGPVQVRCEDRKIQHQQWRIGHFGVECRLLGELLSIIACSSCLKFIQVSPDAPCMEYLPTFTINFSQM